MEENEKKHWRPPEVMELPDPAAYAFEGYGKELRRSFLGKWLRKKEPQTAAESQRLWEDIMIRSFPEPFNPDMLEVTEITHSIEKTIDMGLRDQAIRDRMPPYHLPQYGCYDGFWMMPGYMETPGFRIAEPDPTLLVGETDTQSILRDLGEKEDSNMEMSLNTRKIKSVTINCEDGKTYEGEVARIMGCPYDVSSQELTVKISKQASGDYGIKDVIFQNPATIVFWTDGTKTVVNCMDNVEIKKKIVDGKEVTIRKPRKAETYSAEVGLAMAIAKKWAGNDGNYNNVFRKFVPFMAEAEKAAKKAARKAKKAQKREE